MKRPSPINRHTLYGWLRALVVVAVAMVAVDTFVVMGLVMPTRIEGSSMAPTLLGPHIVVHCPHCDLVFEVAADQVPNSRQYWCPDCGERIAGKATALELGERKWINRIGLALARPQRYEVIVARNPRESTSYCIKRVLGLPNEHVDFNGGDLIVDGRAIRKSLEDQLRLRQLVHEERTALRRWHSEDEMNWQWSKVGAWRHRGDTSRLTFSRPEDPAVTDELGVNQTVPATAHKVTDLMVTCDVKLAPSASLTFVADFPGGESVEHTVSTRSEFSAVWSLFDRQAVLAMDGVVIWSQLQDERGSGPPRLSVIADGELEVRKLTVWRDLYHYTRAIDQWPAGGVVLTDEQFFVAGDNQAVSDDCRGWPGHSLPQELLIGVPMGVN